MAKSVYSRTVDMAAEILGDQEAVASFLGTTPELVASAVVKASTELNPRRRYTAGRVARQISLLRRFVPTAAFDKSLRKQMRLPA